MSRVSLVVVCLLFASVGFGQTGLATITGTITDSSGPLSRVLPSKSTIWTTDRSSRAVA